MLYKGDGQIYSRLFHSDAGGAPVWPSLGKSAQGYAPAMARLTATREAILDPSPTEQLDSRAGARNRPLSPASAGPMQTLICLNVSIVAKSWLSGHYQSGTHRKPQ